MLLCYSLDTGLAALIKGRCIVARMLSLSPRIALPVLLLVLVLLLGSCAHSDLAPPATAARHDRFVDSLPPVDIEAHLSLFDYDREAPLEVEEIKTWREGKATWTDLTYASPRGGRVPATLVVPDGRGPFAGLILMHGMPSNRQEMFGTAAYYARLGAVTLMIDAPWARPELAKRPLQRGYPLTFSESDRDEQVQLILDLRRGVDLLLSEPVVRSDALAYVGVSYGGAMGGLLAGVEDRLQAYVLQVGDGGLVTHASGPDEEYINQYQGSPFLLISDERRALWVEAMWPIEPIHYVGHAAPAALLFLNGLRDGAVPTYDALAYQAAGSEPKDIIWYDDGHSLNFQAIQYQARWLQKQVGPPLLLIAPDYRGSAVWLDWLLLAWVVLTVASLLVVVRTATRTPSSAGVDAAQDVDTSRRGSSQKALDAALLLWVACVLVFGPFGLLVFQRNQHRPQKAGPWIRALAAALIRASLYTLWLAAVLTVMVTLDLGDSMAVSLAVAYVLPFLVLSLLVAAPTLARELDTNYASALRRTLVAELTATLLAMTIMLAVLIALEMILMRGIVDPATTWYWVSMVLVGIAGALVLFPYDYWLARRGFCTWTLLLACRKPRQVDPGVTPSLRAAWAPLVLSFVLFVSFTGLVAVMQGL